MRVLLSWVFLVVLAGCATVSEQSAAPGEAERRYTLHRGDEIKVRVFGEDRLSGTFFVAEDGEVGFPLIGDVPAEGRTIDDLRQAVRTRLEDGYLVNPDVSLVLTNPQPVYVLGEVNDPGEYPYDPNLTIMKAIGKAGDFTFRARRDRVLITRIGDTEERLYKFDAVTPVLPGDTIRVQQRLF